MCGSKITLQGHTYYAVSCTSETCHNVVQNRFGSLSHHVHANLFVPPLIPFACIRTISFNTPPIYILSKCLFCIVSISDSTTSLQHVPAMNCSL